MKTTEGQEAFDDLVKEADIIISNYTTKDALKLGMGFKTLSVSIPVLSTLIDGFGEEEAPFRRSTAGGANGYLYVGERTGPSKMPVST